MILSLTRIGLKQYAFVNNIQLRNDFAWSEILDIMYQSMAIGWGCVRLFRSRNARNLVCTIQQCSISDDMICMSFGNSRRNHSFSGSSVQNGTCDYFATSGKTASIHMISAFYSPSPSYSHGVSWLCRIVWLSNKFTCGSLRNIWGDDGSFGSSRVGIGWHMDGIATP